MVVARFAPSPTGIMTVGNYRTALLSYLFSLKHQGRFLLRIEDTDIERSKKEHEEQIKVDLERMGLQYEKNTILIQSERQDIYKVYFDKLIEKDLAYPCYCSTEELELERKVQLGQAQAPRYSGRCHHLSQKDREEKEKQGMKPTLRFHVNEGSAVTFDDLILGPRVFERKEIGDFIIRKTDGLPTFFFCNALDDALSGVTHVLRGDDHVANTPRQILLCQALGLKEPSYGHFSLIFGHDHKKLSKRTGSRSIKELLEDGYLVEALNNYLARLGHYYQSNEMLSFWELAQQFKLENVSHSPSIYDPQQLQYWQKLAFSQLSEESGIKLIKKFVSIPLHHPKEFWKLVQPNVSLGKELESWAIALTCENTLVSADKLKEYGWTAQHIQIFSNKVGSIWTDITSDLKQTGLKGKNLFMPLRLILTGLEDGPHLEDLYQYVDKDILTKRLEELTRGFETL